MKIMMMKIQKWLSYQYWPGICEVFFPPCPRVHCVDSLDSLDSSSLVWMDVRASKDSLEWFSAVVLPLSQCL